MPSEKEILTLKEVSTFTDLKPGTIYQLVHYRKIPYYKRGKRLYFRTEEIKSWMLMDRRGTLDEMETKAATEIMKRRLS